MVIDHNDKDPYQLLQTQRLEPLMPWYPPQMVSSTGDGWLLCTAIGMIAIPAFAVWNCGELARARALHPTRHTSSTTVVSGKLIHIVFIRGSHDGAFSATFFVRHHIIACQSGERVPSHEASVER